MRKQTIKVANAFIKKLAEEKEESFVEKQIREILALPPEEIKQRLRDLSALFNDARKEEHMYAGMGFDWQQTYGMRAGWRANELQSIINGVKEGLVGSSEELV